MSALHLLVVFMAGYLAGMVTAAALIRPVKIIDTPASAPGAVMLAKDEVL